MLVVGLVFNVNVVVTTFFKPCARVRPTIPAPMMTTGFSTIMMLQAIGAIDGWMTSSKQRVPADNLSLVCFGEKTSTFAVCHYFAVEHSSNAVITLLSP